MLATSTAPEDPQVGLLRGITCSTCRSRFIQVDLAVSAESMLERYESFDEFSIGSTRFVATESFPGPSTLFHLEIVRETRRGPM